MKLMKRILLFILVISLVSLAYFSGRYDWLTKDELTAGGVGSLVGLLLAWLLASSRPKPTTPETPVVDAHPKGLVAFAFALRATEQEPNPCNIRIAKAAERIIREEKAPVIVVAQWEVARQLAADGVQVAKVVELPLDGTYLDSDIVWREAQEIFSRYGVKEVIPVAQPFMQLTKIRMMLNKSGYQILKRPIGWIGFDKKSTQAWTRGPVRLFVYSIKQLLLGLRGHGGRQSA